jgi:DNA polymerase III subunit gamma/tau
MENFIVSARKYRPDSFQTVVGQDSITRTLKNSIKSQQLAQAYLFCGPRGVGKTTCARIFAKTINCFNLGDDMEACNECESCKAFNEMRSMNIHELDAASNNSVDDIRNLIDQVRIPPQIGKYSVYIIDEVHMLSSAAFNAFLKTLEEPPRHVIFILATTEKHKIIPTILSRCQIFDFNRINIKDITSRLQFVSENEGITAEQDALHIIAQKADGAMRDALSIFDQIVSFAGKNITYASTIENLNVLDYDYYFRLTDALLNGNYVESLLIYDDIINNGFDGNFFISGLASHFRDLLMCKDSKTIDLLEVGENIKQKYVSDSARCPVKFLFNALKIANDCDFKYKASTNKRLHIELALLKIAEINTDIEENENVKEQKPAYKSPIQKKPETPKTLTDEKTNDYSIKQESGEEEKSQQKPIGDAKSRNGGVELLGRSISIKNLGINNGGSAESDEERFDVSEIGTDIFDEEKMHSVWLQYAEKIQEKAPRLNHVFSVNKPKLVNEAELLLKLENQNLANAVNSIITELIPFLKKELNNKNISLKIEVEKLQKENDIPYTNEDKFKKMAENNPSLIDLKDQLNLDFK